MIVSYIHDIDVHFDAKKGHAYMIAPTQEVEISENGEPHRPTGSIRETPNFFVAVYGRQE